jgi:hypothetical protein
MRREESPTVDRLPHGRAMTPTGKFRVKVRGQNPEQGNQLFVEQPGRELGLINRRSRVQSPAGPHHACYEQDGLPRDASLAAAFRVKALARFPHCSICTRVRARRRADSNSRRARESVGGVGRGFWLIVASLAVLVPGRTRRVDRSRTEIRQ